MAYSVSWHVHSRILLLKLEGELTSQESEEISNINVQRFDAGIEPVHLIIDISALTKFPTDIRQTSSLARYLRHKKLGWVVVVGTNTMINFLSSLLSQLTGFDYAKRDTIKDAVAFLEKQDDTLVVST